MDAHETNKGYFSPYLTCKECNNINFIDVQRLRTGDGTEILPICTKCKRYGSITGSYPILSSVCSTIHMVVGLHDFAHMVSENEIHRLELGEHQLTSVRLVQRVYRGHLVRRDLAAIREAKRLYEKRRYDAACALQSRARGCAGRRIFMINQCLAIIRVSVHPSMGSQR